MKALIVLFTSMVFLSCTSNINEKVSNNEGFMPSYKELSTDTNNVNTFIEHFDSITNIYSNFRYGFSMNFPNNWDIDKGVSEHTIIRAYEKDSSISCAVNVIEIEMDKNSKQTMWSVLAKNEELIETQLKQMVEKSLKTKIDYYSLEKIYIKNYEALKREYTYTVKNLDYQFEMRTLMYQLINPPYTYTVVLNVPNIFYTENPHRYNTIVDGFMPILKKNP